MTKKVNATISDNRGIFFFIFNLRAPLDVVQNNNEITDMITEYINSSNQANNS